MDNLSTHTQKSLTDRYGLSFTPHYTPKHGSWLNMAELEVGLFSRHSLSKRRLEACPTSPILGWPPKNLTRSVRIHRFKISS
jgi:hypothetical protein